VLTLLPNWEWRLEVNFALLIDLRSKFKDVNWFWASFGVLKLLFLLSGDRPVQITLQRALSSLGLFQKIRLVYHIVMANFSSVSVEDVEKCKDKDLLESLLAELAGEFPQLSKIFVTERDQVIFNAFNNLVLFST
jgi:hypothetical protein